jgi:hypothetical protein
MISIMGDMIEKKGVLEECNVTAAKTLFGRCYFYRHGKQLLYAKLGPAHYTVSCGGVTHVWDSPERLVLDIVQQLGGTEHHIKQKREIAKFLWANW